MFKVSIALVALLAATVATASRIQSPAPVSPSFARSIRSWSRPTPRCRSAAARWRPNAWRAPASPPASKQVQVFTAPDHPKEGGLVALYPGTRSEGQSHAAARAHRRGGSQARGLDPRSVRAGRRERQLLRARRGGRQGRGGDLGRYAGALREREIQTAPRHQARADLRRGDLRRLQRRGVAEPRITATGSTRSSRSTKARGASSTRKGNRVAHERAGGREDRAELPARGHQSRRPQLAAAEGQRHLRSWPARCRASRPTSSRRSSPTPAALTSPAWRRSRRPRAMPTSPRR